MRLNVKVVSFPDGTQKWFLGEDVSAVITDWKESMSESDLNRYSKCAFTVGEVIMPEKVFHDLDNRLKH